MYPVVPRNRINRRDVHPKHLPDDVMRRIHDLRGQRVMLDAELAGLYGVATKTLNQAVSRNILRFPPDFMFRLTATSLKSQIVTSNLGRGGRRRSTGFRPRRR